MAQPECNKTDSDKAREEALISRLVEVSTTYLLTKSYFSPLYMLTFPQFIVNQVVQLRNEVIESLEMDRIREAEEDQVYFKKFLQQFSLFINFMF